VTAPVTRHGANPAMGLNPGTGAEYSTAPWERRGTPGARGAPASGAGRCAARVRRLYHADRRRLLAGAVLPMILACGCGAPALSGADTARVEASRLQADARARLAQGDAAGAVQDLLRTVGLVPDEPGAWNALGLAQQAHGESDTARQSFEHAITLEPRRYEAHLNLAVLLMRTGVSGRARTEFEQAVQAQPGDPLPYWNFATALVDVGKPDQARELLSTALQLDPACGPAHAQMGRVESLAGRVPLALAHFAAAESLGIETPTLRGNYGLELLRADRPAEAEKQLLRALEVDSTRVAEWNHLGVARTRLGRLREALPAFERAHRLAPNDEDIRFNLATAYERQERHADAATLLANPHPARADLLALWGMALRGNRRPREALPLLREAAERAPRDVAILNNLGVVQAETGDVPGALATWRRVLEIEPGNTTARDNLKARGAR
jgi:Tfp pilus assembly protein PilF